ncbi:hypothetical protein U1Q18_003272, partial [Sarracenia purpurea var. burkii]
ENRDFWASQTESRVWKMICASLALCVWASAAACIIVCWAMCFQERAGSVAYCLGQNLILWSFMVGLSPPMHMVMGPTLNGVAFSILGGIFFFGPAVHSVAPSGLQLDPGREFWKV